MTGANFLQKIIWRFSRKNIQKSNFLQKNIWRFSRKIFKNPIFCKKLFEEIGFLNIFSWKYSNNFLQKIGFLDIFSWKSSNKKSKKASSDCPKIPWLYPTKLANALYSSTFDLQKQNYITLDSVAETISYFSNFQRNSILVVHSCNNSP